MGDLEGRWQIDGRNTGDTMAQGVSGAVDADYGKAYNTHLEITKDDGPAVVGPATNHHALRMLDDLPTDYQRHPRERGYFGWQCDGCHTHMGLQCPIWTNCPRDGARPDTTRDLCGECVKTGLAASAPAGSKLQLADHGQVAGRIVSPTSAAENSRIEGQRYTICADGAPALVCEGGGRYHGEMAHLTQVAVDGTMYAVKLALGPRAADGTVYNLRGQWELQPPSEHWAPKTLKQYVEGKGGQLPPGPMEKGLLLATAASLFHPMRGIFHARRVGPPGVTPGVTLPSAWGQLSDVTWPSPPLLPFQPVAEVEVLPHHGTAANCANQADGGVSAGGATLALGDGAAAAPAVHNERSGVRFDTRTRQWRHADDDSLPAGALRHAAAVPTNQGPADCRQELARERAAREALERRVAQLEQIVLRSVGGTVDAFAVGNLAAGPIGAAPAHRSSTDPTWRPDSFEEQRLAHLGSRRHPANGGFGAAAGSGFGAKPAAGGFGAAAAGGFGAAAKPGGFAGGFGAKPAAGGFGAGEGAFGAGEPAGGFGDPTAQPVDSWEPQPLDMVQVLSGGAWDAEVQCKVLRPGHAPIWDVLFADGSTGSYGIKKLRRHPKSGNSGGLGGLSGTYNGLG